MCICNRPISCIKILLAPRLRGIKQKKSHRGSGMNISFLLFYSPEPQNQVEFERGSVTRNFTIFKQNEATVPLFIYKTMLKHQEKEINRVLKEKQVMVGSSPF